MWELDHKEGCEPKNWCFWTVVLGKALESPLDCKDLKPVKSKGNKPWLFIGRTDTKDEAPILWPPDGKNWLIGKDPHAGKDSRQEKGMTGWDGWMPSPTQWREFEQVPEDGEGQGSLMCCRSQGCKESDKTEWLNSNKKIIETQHLLGEKDKNMNIGSEILYLAFLFFSSPNCLVSQERQLRWVDWFFGPSVPLPQGFTTLRLNSAKHMSGE